MSVWAEDKRKRERTMESIIEQEHEGRPLATTLLSMLETPQWNIDSEQSIFIDVSPHTAVHHR